MASPQTEFPPERAKLIYNPASGPANDSLADELLQVLTAMQAVNLMPEVHILQQQSDLTAVIREAMHRGIRLIVVNGGDGTVDSAAAALVGTRATLGIIPGGTQNNVALSLGIPTDIRAAAALLRSGSRVKIDMAMATCQNVTRPFLEVCSVGLLSALFPAADHIQHGNLAAVGDLLTTLFSSPLTSIRLVINDRQQLETQGHVILVGNMPFIGPHFPIAARDSFQDGVLDVLVFSQISKLELLGSAVQMVTSAIGDPRIQRYRARTITIDTSPPMPILADGSYLGKGSLRIHIRRRALSVITGLPVLLPLK